MKRTTTISIYLRFAVFILASFPLSTSFSQHQCDLQPGNPSSSLTNICFYEYVSGNLELMGCLDCQVTGQQIKCGNGVINAAGYSDYDLIMWGTGWCFNPVILPVILRDFMFTDDQFIWSTFSELNNDYFIIEKSYDNQTWEKILQINSLHNTTDQLSEYRIAYNHNDLTAAYFRLSQVDFDGTVTYFDPIHVSSLHNEGVTVYPNPNATRIFKLNKISELESFVLYDAKGTFIKEETIKSEVLHLFDLDAGIYFIHFLQKNGRIAVQKIVLL